MREEKGKVKRGDIFLCVCVCVRQSEPKRERELLLHFLTQARSDCDTYPRDVSSAVLSGSVTGEKNPLTGNLAAQTHHLNSVTHLLRSAVTCLQTRQALSV